MKVSLNFQHTPTVYRAIMSEAFVIGLRGPRGSGKSTGGVGFIMTRAFRQEPDSDGKRKTRWAVIRNTTPELKSTTIKTWLEWMPEGGNCRMTWGSPMQFVIEGMPIKDGTTLHAEVQFFGLDNPRDVKKLMSYECTGAWVNEARWIPKSIVDSLTESVGRYPSPKNGDPKATCSQILLDTNSMDTDHWWPAIFEGGQDERKTVSLPDGSEVRIDWQQYVQPPAVLELQQQGDGFVSIEPGHKGLTYHKTEVIEAAGRYWGVNPHGENLANLLPGYYHRQLAEKQLEHIQVFQQNKYGFVREGRPVIPEYIPHLMGRDFPVIKGADVYMGVDDGGGTLNPAAVFAQRSQAGIWLLQSEVVGSGMGIDRFATLCRQEFDKTFPGCDIVGAWTDPVGENRDEVFEKIVNDYLRREGFPVRPSPTQDPKLRVEAISRPCGRMIGGEPGMLVSKSRCPTLHKALTGAWMFRRLQVGGTERYEDKPSKIHPYSDVGDACGYLLVGAGESRVRVPQADGGGGWRQGQASAQAVVDFDVF